MNYSEIYQIYSNLKENLALKKNAIVKRNLDELHRIDEELIVLCEQLKTKDIKEIFKTFTDNEKNQLKELALEIKKLENNNEILIKHSLDVINNLMSGILNIAKQDISSYNSKGMNCTTTDILGTSSITEEA